jgi:hypothetical protein
VSFDFAYPLWQRDRSLANHDWLQNRFLVALGKWENVCSGQVEDDDFEESFVSRGLREWPARCAELEKLIVRFETEMSPAQVLTVPPLLSCDTETKVWLSALIDSVWRKRIGVEELVGSATEALEAVNRSFDVLKEALIRGRLSPGRCEQVATAVISFRRSCERLAGALSRFPSEILVA